jgi:lipid A ethanolaminephosphotransferase
MIRPVRLEVANFCLAAYFVAVLNIAFWRQFFAAVAPASVYEFLFVAVTVVIAFCLLVLFFGLFALPSVFKPVMTLLLLLTAAVAYFMNEYGVVIDVDMVRNVFLTNRAEAGDLITLKLFLFVLVLGGLPALLLWACTITYRPLWQEFWFRTKATAALLATVTVVAFPFAQNMTSVFREQRILQHVFMPWNYLSALAD